MGNYNSTKSLGLSKNQKRNTIIPFNYILHNEIERSIKSRRTISETKSNLSSASQKKVKNNPFFKRSHFHKKISSIKTISNLIHSFHKIKTDNIHRITVIEGFFSIKNLIKKEDEPSFFICEPITKNVDNSVSMFLSPEEADMINKICRTETSSNKKLKQVRKRLKPPVPTIKINLKEVVAESQRSTNNNTKNVLKAKKTMTKSRTKNVLGPFTFKNKIKQLEDELNNITEIKNMNDKFDTNDNSQTFIDMVDDFRNQLSYFNYKNMNYEDNKGYMSGRIFIKKKVMDRFTLKQKNIIE